MREFTPSREQAHALAADHALIPVYREVLADMLTPVLAYTLLCPEGEPGFLLESVEGGERLARFSFIGAQPRPLEVGSANPLPALQKVGNYMKHLDAIGLPPEKIAERVYQALTTAHPRVRYQIAPDPMRHLMTAYLPKRMVDRIIAKRLGLMPET